MLINRTAYIFWGKLLVGAIFALLVLIGCVSNPLPHQSIAQPTLSLDVHKPIGEKGIAEVIHKVGTDHIMPVDRMAMFKEGARSLGEYDSNLHIIVNSNVIRISYEEFGKDFDLSGAKGLGDEELSLYLGNVAYKIIDFARKLSPVIAQIDLNTLEARLLDRAVQSIDWRSHYIQTFRYADKSGHTQISRVDDLLDDYSMTDYVINGNILYFQMRGYFGNYEAFKSSLDTIGVTEPLYEMDIILDLRGNYGGRLQEILSFLDLFVSNEVVAKTIGRAGSNEMEFRTNSDTRLLKNRIVLLVDGATSTGAEILVLALMKYREAIVIGMSTFGDSYVTTYSPLHNGNMLVITTKQILDANGQPVPVHGIEPDICTNMARLSCLSEIYNGPRGSDKDPDFIAAVNYLTTGEMSN